MSVKRGKWIAGAAVGTVGLILLTGMINGSGGNSAVREQSFPGTGWQEEFVQKVEKQVFGTFLPVFSYVQEPDSLPGERWAEEQLERLLPVYGFVQRKEQDDGKEQLTLEMLLKAEGQKETHAAEEASDVKESKAQEPAMDTEELAALLQAENETAASRLQKLSSVREFVPHTEKQLRLDWESLRDYDNLVKNYYTIDKSTMIGSDQLNVDVLLEKDMTISKEAEGPQILIYHTHSQETFADSVPGDRATSIVGVGDYLTKLLTEKYGYEVLHHDGEYDVPVRDDAYSVALPAIEQLLDDNPQIQVVIDLHRDAVAEETRLVTEIDGRPTARFMFFNGLSRTRNTGNITYLHNENIDDNLAFSFQLQTKALEYYPGLTRKIYLKAYRYNMHFRPRNLLVELGAQNNTVEEAMNACDPLAHLLDMVLSGQAALS